MKKLFLVTLLLCFGVMMAWCIKNNTTTTPERVPQGQDTPNHGVISWNVISELTVYQILPQQTQFNYTWSKTETICGDSLVGVPVATAIPISDQFAWVWKTLTLLDRENQWLTNPWKNQKNVAFYSYEIQDKTLLINLTGAGLLVESDCDISRLLETAKATYKELGFDSVELWLQGSRIDEEGE